MKKRQHYLPKFYLAGFTNESGKFWIFDRENKEFRIQTPKNTAVEKEYYTLINEKGERDYIIEDLVSFVEGHTKPIFEKLEKRKKINKIEKENLALFVSILWTRVPDFEKSIVGEDKLCLGKI